MLVGAEEHDTVEIPEAVHRALRRVVEALMAGKAVTIAPQNKMLTTQQAADILGVSRPTVVKLIDAKVLPAETPGVRRRLVKLSDVLEYRKVRREQQYHALMETSVEDDESEADATARAQEMREVRAEIRKRRAERKASI
jgi:excisionase family DNA binding protein